MFFSFSSPTRSPAKSLNQQCREVVQKNTCTVCWSATQSWWMMEWFCLVFFFCFFLLSECQSRGGSLTETQQGTSLAAEPQPEDPWLPTESFPSSCLMACQRQPHYVSLNSGSEFTRRARARRRAQPHGEAGTRALLLSSPASEIFWQLKRVIITETKWLQIQQLGAGRRVASN